MKKSNQTDIPGIYFKDLSKFPLLNRQEELELAKRVREGDQEARKKMIEGNLRLVVSIAMQYVGRHPSLNLPDLIGYGNIGLQYAVDGFNWRQGNRFSTYASYWIRQPIRAALANLVGIIRIPRYITSDMSKFNKTKAELQRKKGKEPSLEEISEKMGKKPKAVHNVIALYTSTALLRKTLDLDATDLSDNSSSPDVFTEDIIYLKQTIKSALLKLSFRERIVIALRFGLTKSGKKHALKKIGRRLRLTRERVRQIQRDALAQLSRDPAVKKLNS